MRAALRLGSVLRSGARDARVLGAVSGILALVLAACGDGIGRPLRASADGGVAGLGGVSESGGASGLGGMTGGADRSAGRGSLGGTKASLGGSGGSFGRSSGNALGGNKGRPGPPGGFDEGEDDDGGSDGDLDWMGGFVSQGGPESALTEVPSNELCARVATATWANAAEEQSFFDALNSFRAYGKRCGTVERGAPLPRLENSPELWCAARLHSLDMVQRQFFDHVNPDGEDQATRIARAGYAAESVGELLVPAPARDQVGILLGFFDGESSDCEALLGARFHAVGVGFHEGYWTIDLAAAQP